MTIRSLQFALASMVVVLCLSSSVKAQTIPFVIAGAGDIPGGAIPLAPFAPVAHTTQAGWGVKLGPHTGSGSFQLIAPPDLATLTAQFNSAQPYHFVSSANGNDVLACNYGVTTGDLPADEPGSATFVSIDSGADPNSPFDDTFIIFFLAEFRPELSECSGKFAPSRLRSGSFTMLAISEPVQIDPVNGVVVNAGAVGNANLDPIPYSWYGVGSLTFKWPFGWF